MVKKKLARRVPFETPTPKDLQTSAAQRAFDSFTRTIGKETTKATKADLARRKAMAAALPCLIETLEGDALTELFFGFEDNATASDRKEIATHPDRPDAVDDLHAAAVVEREAEEERQLQESEAADLDAEKATATASRSGRKDAIDAAGTAERA